MNFILYFEADWALNIFSLLMMSVVLTIIRCDEVYTKKHKNFYLSNLIMYVFQTIQAEEHIELKVNS